MPEMAVGLPSSCTGSLLARRCGAFPSEYEPSRVAMTPATIRLRLEALATCHQGGLVRRIATAGTSSHDARWVR